jgi:hypothetical protein
MNEDDLITMPEHDDRCRRPTNWMREPGIKGPRLESVVTKEHPSNTGDDGPKVVPRRTNPG